jgi:hypothetical protein
MTKIRRRNNYEKSIKLTLIKDKDLLYKVKGE